MEGGELIMKGSCIFRNCSSQYEAGGIWIDLNQGGLINISNMKVKSCKAITDGGGMFLSSGLGSKIILDKSEIYQCESNGNGGGIYSQIFMYSESRFIIKDTIIHECKSTNQSQYSYPESGFGGGIFLICDGKYYPSSKNLDFHGMKIYNNSADKFGQSLYVVMNNVSEWCQYGILGEYVKGNYSDTYSNETDIEGIAMNMNTFNSATQQLIQQKQQPLELFWRILGILNKANVIAKVSMTKTKLSFILEGQNMIS
ncbi:MAG: hypothetical protein EZS28_035516, partial [Streblomastix strix]